MSDESLRLLTVGEELEEQRADARRHGLELRQGDVLARAAEAAQAIVTPIDDMRGTRDYRIHVTGVLVRRTLEAAVVRARGEALDYHPGRD